VTKTNSFKGLTPRRHTDGDETHEEKEEADREGHLREKMVKQDTQQNEFLLQWGSITH
jgi:hypothetical protein